jgi:hypothetical protein
MSGIQILLVASFLLLAIYFFVRLRNRIADVLLMLALVGLAVVFVLFPDLTSMIAKKLGVGRGADMVFYTCIVLFWFVILKLYSKVRSLEQLVTNLLREQALQQVEKMKR